MIPKLAFTVCYKPMTSNYWSAVADSFLALLQGEKFLGSIVNDAFSRIFQSYIVPPGLFLFPTNQWKM